MQTTNKNSVLDSCASFDDVSDSDWTALGFSDAVRVRATFAALRARPEGRDVSVEQCKSVVRALSACSDPTTALKLFENWIEVGGIALTPSWLEPEFLKALFALFSATPALSSYFIRFPNRT